MMRFHTALSVPECEALLTHALSPEAAGDARERNPWVRPFRGWARGGGLRIYRQGPRADSFSAFAFHASLAPAGTGTLVEGRLKAHILVQAFAVLGAAFLVMAAALSALVAVSKPGGSLPGGASGALMLSTVAAGVLGLFFLGNWQRGSDERDVSEFLCRTLSASPAPTPPSAATR